MIPTREIPPQLRLLRARRTLAAIVPDVPRPLPVANAGGPYTATAGVALQVSRAGSYSPNGDWTALWDWGDGSAPSGPWPGLAGAPPAGADASHTYTTIGAFRIRLTVADAYGSADAYADVVVSASAATVASVEVSPDPVEGYPGGAVDLTAVAKEADGDVVPGKTGLWESTNAGIASVPPGPSAIARVSLVAPGSAGVWCEIDTIQSNTVGVVVNPLPTGLWPHLPANMTRLAELRFRQLPGTGGADDYIYPGGTWWQASGQGPGTGWEILTDPDGTPSGDGKVYQFKWPAGLENDPAHGWDATWKVPFPNGLRHMYWAYWAKIPQDDFECNAVFKPFGYLKYANLTQNNEWFPMQYGKDASGSSGKAGIHPGPWTMLCEIRDSLNADGTSDIHQPNFGTISEWRANRQWVLWEWEHDLGHIGQFDGFLKGWVTPFGGASRQFANIQNEGFLPCAVVSGGAKTATVGFFGIHHNPIWGGSLTSYGAKKRNDYQWYDGMMFAANLTEGAPS